VRLFNWLKRASVSKANPQDPVVATWFGGRAASSGATVTAETALQVAAVYACVRILAESIASLPLNLMTQSGARREHATGHPLYWPMKNQPNRWQTSYEWREMMIGHAALRGNAYSEIVPGRANPVAELVPLHPGRVRPFLAPDNALAYEYSPPEGEKRIILGHEMHHLRGLSSDGYVGLSPVDLMREPIGLAIAQEQHGGSFFGNGATPGGVLEHPGVISDEAATRLKKAWEQRHQGAGNAHRLAVLEEGMKWQTIGIEPEKAQLLGSRKFQVTEIARIFRIPPHMLADLERATFSNIEHQGLEFVIHTLMPWLVRWEQALLRDLITKANQRTHYWKFNTDALLRGDTKTRFEAYAVGRGWGWLSVNDVREKEDQNPITDGDQYLVPLNMTTADKLGADDGMSAATAERIARKEHRAFTRALHTEAPPDMPEWVEDFCDKHAVWATTVAGKDTSAVVEHLRTNWQDLPRDADEFISERAAQYLEVMCG
jgi:HK97 family phage portal protein